MGETSYVPDLIDLIDPAILQKMQDSFSKMTGIAAYIVDGKGGFVTEGSGTSVFCTHYTRGAEIGKAKCLQCDFDSARHAFDKGEAITYHCHMGLLNMAAPIVMNGELIGCFHGGQILDEEKTDEELTACALEIGVDPYGYIQSYRHLPVVPKEKVNRAVLFLNTITKSLSSIAYHNYVILHENAKIRRATNLKSDFLANMSHEIRTPMNAIIGMAEMSLREEVTPVAREYINQIKIAGKNLLSIINDILDYSKIDSGKMEITMAEYEPMSLINDVANIVMTHINEDDVQFILDISPDIPRELLGDSLRIKQILLNIVGNAIKFTKNGYIIVKVEPSWISDEEIIIRATVQDTGIGIKKADLEKLFESFEQVDSKRNRNLEGTGLGLAISQQLVRLMLGSIEVESEFGKGSKFSFHLPQRITSEKPSITLKRPIPKAAAGLTFDPVFQAQLKKDIKRLHITYIALESEEELNGLLDMGCKYVFIEREMYTDTVKEFVKKNLDITAVLVVHFQDTVKEFLPNLLIVKKPIYALNLAMIFNQESVNENYSNVMDEDYEFIAPEANILIVDDNQVNLTVAEGLLKPLQINIDTAQSGKEAINKVTQRKYDLIFMDHQMPDLDGIKTTHIIRRFHEEYARIPIVAFSAQISTETEMMFLNEGLNDCVAKPFELRMMISTLKRWLPKEKIQKASKEDEETFEISSHGGADEPYIPVIDGLDVEAALKLLGSEKLLWEVLKDYYRIIQKKAEEIKRYEKQEDFKNYTVEVHALKSASKQIGATQLSELAARLEKAGNEKDGAVIHRYTDRLLAQYLHLDKVLAPYFSEDDISTEEKEKGPIPNEIRRRVFGDMRAAIADLDIDQMEGIILEMGGYSYEGWQKELYGQLKEAAEVLDVDTCESILEDWEEKEKDNGN